jgi:hypothetical protein
MNNHYVYQITFLEVPHIYFGARSCKRLPEEDVKYMGSPKTYKHYWKENTPIKTILVTGFSTRGEANLYEKELISQQWAQNISLSLNASIGGEKFHMEGVPQTPESRKKRSNTKKGVPNPKVARSFVGISPNGEIIKFTNAQNFCIENPEWNFFSTTIIVNDMKGASSMGIIILPGEK